MSPFFDAGVGQAVEEHVHLADGPGAEVLLLAVEGQVARVAPAPLDEVGALDQHAAGAGGRVADAHAFGRRQQLDDEPDDHPRRVELAPLLAGVVGELLDQVLVGAAEKVGLGHAVVAERDLREVLDETREHGVAVAGVAEPALVVVVDAGEDAFQRRVLLLERRARLVQGLADVVGRPLDGPPPRPVRHEELVLVRVGPRDIFWLSLRDQLLRLLLEPVRQPLQEEQAEDVGLVVAAVDRPAQDVRGRPEVLLELGDAQDFRGQVRGFRNGRGCRLWGGTSVAFWWCRVSDGTGGPLRGGTAVAFRWRRMSDETGGDIRLLATGIVEAEGPAQLLQAVPREVGQDLVEPRLPRCGQGVDEFRFYAAVIDGQIVVLNVGAELVRGQLRENGAFRWHWSVPPIWELSTLGSLDAISVLPEQRESSCEAVFSC